MSARAWNRRRYKDNHIRCIPLDIEIVPPHLPPGGLIFNLENAVDDGPWNGTWILAFLSRAELARDRRLASLKRREVRRA